MVGSHGLIAPAMTSTPKVHLQRASGDSVKVQNTFSRKMEICHWHPKSLGRWKCKRDSPHCWRGHGQGHSQGLLMVSWDTTAVFLSESWLGSYLVMSNINHILTSAIRGVRPQKVKALLPKIKYTKMILSISLGQIRTGNNPKFIDRE